MRTGFLILFWFVITECSAGGIDTSFTRPASNRYYSAQQIKELKHGALIVRLKTNDKSVEAYRNAGQNALADKIVAERNELNLKIAQAFTYYFTFCKVYFIYAKNSEALQKKQPGIFLNDKLEPDTSIKLKESYYLTAEYGSFTTNERVDEYHYSGVNRTQPSTSTAGSSALVIMDSTFNQLQEPFPFVSPVYLGAFIKAAEQLDRQLNKFYTNIDLKEYWQNANLQDKHNKTPHQAGGPSSGK